ncbi:phage major capsid protein [Actinomadura sp. DC4]|uniref:phage major capsid protein n=1 Tax=Actinomadura sp. DC4 TaxID=3055069 RepID=UPI0025B05766|nr:phage major capsid protein [Actinomadura sp. DC4]MDN3356075.1 phage major capsid protein [Actinomadura sp. DC4]
MSDRLNTLIDEQNRVWTRMQEITGAAEAENRDMTAEERTNWDAAETRLTEVSGDIERLNRMAALDKVDRGQLVAPPTIDQPGERRDVDEDAEVRYAEAFGAYLRRGMTRLSVEQQDLLQERFEARAGSTQDDTLGGYTVPEAYRAVLTETMKAFGGIYALATVITTSTGQDLPWPTSDDTGNEGEYLTENTQVNNGDVTFGQRKLSAYTINSKMVRLPLQLLQDNAFDLNTWLPRKQGERIGRRGGRAFATGTGVEQPEGILTNCTVGKTGGSGQTTSIIYDDLVDLEHSIDPAYRNTAQYVMADGMLKAIRKLKDTQGRPLWVPIPAPGFPATINGFKYTIDNSFPVPAANAKTVLFGDVAAGYIIRQVLAVQNLRLTERYADFLQVGYLAFARHDGKPDDTSAIRCYQHAAS